VIFHKAGLKPVFILDALRGSAWDRGFLLVAFLVSAKGSGRERPLYTGSGLGGFRIKVKVKVKVKGNGQECPFHTGKSKSNINVNVNVKGGAAGVRGSHLSQKTRKMGHPRLRRVRWKSTSRSKATDRSVRPTLALRRFAPLTAGAAVSTCVVALHANSGFLSRLGVIGMTKLF
jgi:hypothetical protein